MFERLLKRREQRAETLPPLAQAWLDGARERRSSLDGAAMNLIFRKLAVLCLSTAGLFAQHTQWLPNTRFQHPAGLPQEIEWWEGGTDEVRDVCAARGGWRFFVHGGLTEEIYRQSPEGKIEPFTEGLPKDTRLSLKLLSNRESSVLFALLAPLDGDRAAQLWFRPHACEAKPAPWQAAPVQPDGSAARCWVIDERHVIAQAGDSIRTWSPGDAAWKPNIEHAGDMHARLRVLGAEGGQAIAIAGEGGPDQHLVVWSPEKPLWRPWLKPLPEGRPTGIACGADDQIVVLLQIPLQPYERAALQESVCAYRWIPADERWQTLRFQRAKDDRISQYQENGAAIEPDGALYRPVSPLGLWKFEKGKECGVRVDPYSQLDIIRVQPTEHGFLVLCQSNHQTQVQVMDKAAKAKEWERQAKRNKVRDSVATALFWIIFLGGSVFGAVVFGKSVESKARDLIGALIASVLFAGVSLVAAAITFFLIHTPILLGGHGRPFRLGRRRRRAQTSSDPDWCGPGSHV